MTLYCLLLATIIGTTVGVEIEPRILRGVMADPGDFPSIVSLRNGLNHFCGGSIFNKKWVVTAAHCLVYVTTSTVIVSGTTSRISGDEHRIVYWVKHEDYEDRKLNDIGLIKIEDAFEFNDLTHPLKFINPQVNSTCFVAGWGLNENGKIPINLYFTEQRVVNLQDCELFSNVDERKICVSAEPGEGSCDGDSGGPLVCNGKFAGIVSAYWESCATRYPHIFTRAAAYKDWIQDTIDFSYNY